MAVCPEVEVGMPTPSEPIRLEVRSDEIHLIAPKSGIDHTAAMTDYSNRRVTEPQAEELCGYVLKKDSPSCGLWRVRVYAGDGVPERTGRGLFAQALQHMHGHVTDELDRDSRHELLGVIEDYRLSLVPLIVPITLLRHYVRRFDIEYLEGHTYLEPHPKELMLRNSV